KLAGDVWELEAFHPGAHERTGYPTQKPEALLDRVVRASSPPGGLVCDFFLGSGTSLITAIRAGRRFLGGDISAEALAVAEARVEALSGEVPDLEIETSPPV